MPDALNSLVKRPVSPRMNLKMLPWVLLLLLTSNRLEAIDTELARVQLVIGIFALEPFVPGQPEKKSAMTKVNASEFFQNLKFLIFKFQNIILLFSFHNLIFISMFHICILNISHFIFCFL